MRLPIHNKVINKETGLPRPKKRVYTVWLVSRWTDEWTIYYCPDCRNPIIEYKGDLIAEIPGEVKEGYPIRVQCKNPNCGRKVVFKEVIEQLP